MYHSSMKKILASTAVFVFASVFVGCGGAPAPVKPVDTDPEKTAPPPAAEVPGFDPEKVAQCLANANAKRAKFSGEPPKITVKHILVKYQGSKNPVDSAIRTREEASMRAIEARDKIVGGADFDDVVKEFSDEPGAATPNGSIGSVVRKDLA